jgi:hypothetical protein
MAAYTTHCRIPQDFNNDVEGMNPVQIQRWIDMLLDRRATYGTDLKQAIEDREDLYSIIIKMVETGEEAKALNELKRVLSSTGSGFSWKAMITRINARKKIRKLLKVVEREEQGQYDYPADLRILFAKYWDDVTQIDPGRVTLAQLSDWTIIIN